MGHEQFEEAVALYAVGALEPQEREELEAHLGAGCTACRDALTEYQEVAGLLPNALPPDAAPADLKSRLLAAYRRDFPQSGTVWTAGEARHESQEGIGRLVPQWLTLISRPAFALASLLLLVGTGIYAVNVRTQVEGEVAQRRQIETALQTEAARLASLQQQLADQERMLVGLREELSVKLATQSELGKTLARRENEVERLLTQLALREREVTDLTQLVAQRDEILTFLRSPRMKVVSLAGVESAKSAGALLLFDPETKNAFFYAFNMPPLPPGKTYQLWAIVDKPVSAGTFDTDMGQKGRLLIRSIPEDISRIKKFAVSLEPEGGRPQPTGDIYLVGQL